MAKKKPATKKKAVQKKRTTGTNEAISKVLKAEISKALPQATHKIYHGIPVWFIGENAVVGIRINAKKVMGLLFWNGQALKEPALKPMGSFKAAEIYFKDVSEIKLSDLRRWLKKAGKDIWDFASIRKNC